MARGYKKYELSFILETLSVLILNNNDVRKTSIETNVHEDTIERWIKQYSIEYKEQIQALMTSRAAVDVSQSMQQYRESAVSEIEKVKDMIVMRMKDIVPKTRNLDQLSRSYKIIHDCINGVKDGGATEDKSFLTIFNMQINGMQGRLEEPTKDIEYEPTDD